MPPEKLSRPFQASSGYAWQTLLESIHEAVYLVNRGLNIEFANEASELLTGFSSSEVMGKPCHKNFLIQQDAHVFDLCIKNCPVELTYTDGIVRKHKAYLRHKDGFLFPVDLRIIPYNDSRGNTVSVLEAFLDDSPRILVPQKTEELKRTNLLDPLISQGNRRYLEMHLHSRLEEKKKIGMSFGVLYMYVDDIHTLFDKYGSVIKDRIFQTISLTLSNNIRFFEVLGRWEEDEFVVVLLHIDEVHLELVANKLRLLVEQSTIRTKDILLKPTVSVGATLAHTHDTLEILINRAKKLADQSKKLGKNRVSLTFKD